MKRLLNAVAAGTLFVIMIFISAAAFAATEKAAPMPKQEASLTADASAGSLSGKVVETMNAGGYTYVSLEKNGKKTWAAVPQMQVTVGQEISLQPGQEMRNFTSKSLNKTFESIIFSGGPAAAQGSQAMPAGHGVPKDTTTVSKVTATADKNVKVEKATGADAYTVGEIFSKRTSLDKKTAVVRGKVVKVSAGIMGKNWIHVQDGTGDASEGTNKLVVTSDDMPAVGDVVTVKGTVSKDKDFGAGYKYNVIMEKASISKQ